MIDTDGNLAALRGYEREQDRLEAQDEAERQARQDISDSLFDAYATGNSEVVDEVHARLEDFDSLLPRLQKAMQLECTRPVMGRGPEIYDALLKLVSEACDDMAEAGYEL